MLAKTPKTGFAEIGAVKMDGATGGGGLGDLLRFKNQIRSHVCKVGGDAIVAHTSDSGVFVAATIWKKTEATSTENAKGARTRRKIATASGASADPADGCHEDEQCEGDQLCIDGKCALPPAAPLVAAPHSEDEEASPAGEEGE